MKPHQADVLKQATLVLGIGLLLLWGSGWFGYGWRRGFRDLWQDVRTYFRRK